MGWMEDWEEGEMILMIQYVGTKRDGWIVKVWMMDGKRMN